MGLIRLNNQSLTNVTTLPAADGSSLTGVSAGKVLQVKQAVKTDTFSHNTTTLTAIPDLSVSITPSSSSSKILIMGTINVGASNASSYGGIVLHRDGSVLTGSIGDQAGSSRQRHTTANTKESNIAQQKPLNFSYLDSPATTSAITYQPYIQKGAETVTLYVNTYGGDVDNPNHNRSMSSITVMEIEA